MRPKRYRHKPTAVVAVRFTPRAAEEIAKWCSGTVFTHKGKTTHMMIQQCAATQQEQVYAYPGDWIVFGGGRFAVMVDADFRKAYRVSG